MTIVQWLSLYSFRDMFFGTLTSKPSSLTKYKQSNLIKHLLHCQPILSNWTLINNMASGPKCNAFSKSSGSSQIWETWSLTLSSMAVWVSVSGHYFIKWIVLNLWMVDQKTTTLTVHRFFCMHRNKFTEASEQSVKHSSRNWRY